MEPQVVDICFKKEKKRKCSIDLVIFIISLLIAFVIGLIIGALTGILVLLNLGEVITFLATLILLLVLRIINLICYKNKSCC